MISKNKNRGMTLIEIMVAIAILGIILSLGLIISFDSYRGYSFRSESSVVVSILERARSRALNNFYQSPHGVCYDSTNKNYVLFRGSSFGSAVAQETTPANPSVTISPSSAASFFCSSNQGIVFSQITGDFLSARADIVLVQNNRTS